MLYVLLLAAFVGLLWLMRRDTLARGKEEEKAAAMRRMLDDAKKIKDARSALSANPDGDSAKWVRDKYTRR